MGLALGPIARLWTRGLYRNLISTTSWGKTVHLDEEGIKEIKFWQDTCSFEETAMARRLWLSDPKPEIFTLPFISFVDNLPSVYIQSGFPKNSTVKLITCPAEQIMMTTVHAESFALRCLVYPVWPPHRVDRLSSFKTREILYLHVQ